jgi:hypothetical protein
VKVHGTGFTAVPTPKADGVYIGLAPSGGLPDVSDREESAKNFAGFAWIPAAAIKGGAFSSSLNAPTNKLVKGTSYSVYTWSAHEHSTTSQDTETPVTIDWSQLRAASTVGATIVKKPTTKKAGKLMATVTGAAKGSKPTGEVSVKITKNGKVVKELAGKTLNKKGKAAFVLPKRAKGKYRAVVSYAGDENLKASTGKKQYKITR